MLKDSHSQYRAPEDVLDAMFAGMRALKGGENVVGDRKVGIQGKHVPIYAELAWKACADGM